MLRHQFFVLLVCAGTSSAACAVVHPGRPSAVTTGATWTCAPPNSEIPQSIRTWLLGYTEPKSAAADSFRARLQLPRIPRDSVAVVDTLQLCQRAGLAYARENGQQLSPGVYEMALVRAGNRYIARGVTAPATAGEWNTISIFDLRFRLITSVLGF
jgi:hypothetical protein